MASGATEQKKRSFVEQLEVMFQLGGLPQAIEKLGHSQIQWNPVPLLPEESPRTKMPSFI